ncbi:MAG TPA: RNA polymerase sigma factor SigJ [Phycisphaerae bacterium]|nr:RNA polymerase sigma factor SigJ [Phycisphaerae bacterium]HRW54363.1 RNA polymerase sigma factor SigJ [Phycisphaerae bacterium]
MTDTMAFDNERDYLIRLCYRMLGDVSEAEDIVQDAWLRWRSAGEPILDAPRAWFTRTCARLCLDRLKSVQRQREHYIGEWLPEPILPAVADRHERDETLSMALLVAVERLRPAERAAFLLHDVFDYSFEEVADILELNPANCRQLAARARTHLAGERVRSDADEATIRRLSNAFFQAIDAGDLADLRNVLADDVILRSDGGGKVAAALQPIVGADNVIAFLQSVLIDTGNYLSIRRHAAYFNGAPGELVYQDGALASAFHFQVDGQRVVGIYVQRNPDKLAKLARKPKNEDSNLSDNRDVGRN